MPLWSATRKSAVRQCRLLAAYPMPPLGCVPLTGVWRGSPLSPDHGRSVGALLSKVSYIGSITGYSHDLDILGVNRRIHRDSSRACRRNGRVRPPDDHRRTIKDPFSGGHPLGCERFIQFSEQNSFSPGLWSACEAAEGGESAKKRPRPEIAAQKSTEETACYLSW